MSALKPVGINTTISTSTTSAQSSAVSQQSDTIRVVAETVETLVLPLVLIQQQQMKTSMLVLLTVKELALDQQEHKE